MQHKTYETERLSLNPMELNNAPFMLKLLNTPGWLEFIGDKNVKTIEEAEKYIANFTNNHDALFWVVSTKETKTSLGVISIMQRSYLPSSDIGFSFLPEFEKNGFAFEAAHKIATIFKEENTGQPLLAITLEANTKSQKLLKNLGLTYTKNIIEDDEKLMLFSSNNSFFDANTNPAEL